MVWALVFAGAFILFWLPLIAAMIRGTEPLWPVVLATVLTAFTGVCWFVAWIMVFALPRRQPAPPRRPVLAAQDDPECLFGGVPPAIPAGVSRRAVGAGSGASVSS